MMADKENFSNVVESLLKGMDTVLSTKTVVGEPTQVGDTIILPLMDVSFGVAATAGNNGEKNKSNGAGGIGGKMTPSAVLVVKDGNAKIVTVKGGDAVTKVIDMIPELVDKFKKKDEKSAPDVTDEEAIDIAFQDKE